jgi:hypothetical protein
LIPIGSLAHGLRQAAIVQNAVKTETLPELISDVDRASFTMLLGRDPGWIDGDFLHDECFDEWLVDLAKKAARPSLG